MVRIRFNDMARGDRHAVPSAIYEELLLYVDEGIMPSNFIQQCLAGSLFGAANGEDHVNGCLLVYIARMVYRKVPSLARGDFKTVQAWCAHSGLSGWPEDKEFYWS